MNRSSNSGVFWGPRSPLACLSGMGLLVMASSRTAFALVIAPALLWVYGLTVPVFFAAARVFPARGRQIILVFLAGFFGSLFLLFIWLLNPLLALELKLLIALTPVCCAASGIFSPGSGPWEPETALSRALGEGAVLGLLILALALIREPLGYATLSFPGGPRGIVEIFGGEEGKTVFPVHIAASSAGGLLLLGYGLAVYRHFRLRYAGKGDEP